VAGAVDSSPLKNHLVEGTDMIIVRELTGGLYYGTPRGIENDRRGEHHDLYARGNRARNHAQGVPLARGRRKKITSVDKSNVIENSQLWRRVVIDVAKSLSGCGIGSPLGRQLRDAAHSQSAPLRCGPDREHVRRYSE
jgi:3-isopropylmalate dehydrogenase